MAILLSTILVLLVLQIEKHGKWRATAKWIGVTLVTIIAGIAVYAAYSWHSENIRRASVLAATVRETRARPCIADDVRRMEALVLAARESINETMSIADAQKAIQLVLKTSTSVAVPNDSLREMVVVATVRTKCDSDFHFLINVRGRRIEDLNQGDSPIRRFDVLSENTPAGYQALQFSLNFEQLSIDRGVAAENRQRAELEALRKRKEESEFRERQAAENRALAEAAAAQRSRRDQELRQLKVAQDARDNATRRCHTSATGTNAEADCARKVGDCFRRFPDTVLSPAASSFRDPPSLDLDRLVECFSGIN